MSRDAGVVIVLVGGLVLRSLKLRRIWNFTPQNLLQRLAGCRWGEQAFATGKNRCRYGKRRVSFALKERTQPENG
jgi:hypothetical protein